jgi:CRISPR/Cas system-associated exonuclease Cas4 (RecB family)
MFINTMSPSKLKTYKECKKKYQFKYVEYLQGIYNVNSNTDALQYGSYVHKIFELGTELETLEELQNLAGELRPNYQFSSIKEKNLGLILENFFKFNKQLEETVSNEMVFKVDITDDYSINGIIDRVIKGKSGGYLVIDYKTSRRPTPKSELFTDPQMLMYAYAISKEFNVPIDKIAVAHYYPHLDKLVSVRYGRAQVSVFLRELKNKIWEIRKTKKEQLKASQNQWCNWCQYKDLCPEFGGTEKCLLEAKEAEKKAKDN